MNSPTATGRSMRMATDPSGGWIRIDMRQYAPAVEGDGQRGVAMSPMAIEGLSLIVGVLLVLFWSSRDGIDD